MTKDPRRASFLASDFVILSSFGPAQRDHSSFTGHDRRHRNAFSSEHQHARAASVGGPRLQMVYGADGALGLCAHHPDRLRTGARLAPGSAQIRLALPDEFRLGPGERKIRSAALHLRYARLI